MARLGQEFLYTKSDPRLYTHVGRRAERLHMHGFSNRALACVIAAVFALPLILQPAKALDNVTLITDFGYNGRHAYFFVAIEKGYYKEADLDVKVVRGQGSVDAIRQVGPEHVILSTDLGGVPPNTNYPLEAQGFQLYLEEMHKLGFSLAELNLMAKTNPALALGLEPK